jgi:glycosyltransferase involved in cell wall biosynthesis
LTELPLVSLVTPTYNRAKFLPETVKSVLEQSYSNIEFIVVDDGSTDATDKYLATLPPQVKVLRQSNAGQVAALTAGWSASCGKYLSYLSDDDVLLPAAVAELVKHLEAEPEAAATFPNTNLIDQNGRIVRERLGRPFCLRGLAIEQECYIGPGAIFRRSVYDTVGGWDSLCKLGPDREFWLRVGSVGRIDFNPEVLALYRVHSGSLSINGIVSDELVDEFIYVANKFFDGPFCPSSLRASKNMAVANANLVAARGHLRNANLNRFARSIATAHFHHPGSLNLKAMTTLVRAVVPHQLKQSLGRMIRSIRRRN